MVEDRRQPLDPIHQPRAGAAEAAVGVHGIHPAPAHRPQGAPLGAVRRSTRAARRPPPRRSRRASPRSRPGPPPPPAPRSDGPSDRRARRWRRRRPPSAIISGTQWPPANGGSSHSSASTRGRGRPATAARTAASRRSRSASSASAAAVRPVTAPTRRMSAKHLAERPRIERDQLGAAGEGADGAVHLRRRHRADRAELLGDDDVRRQLGDPRLVERVEAEAAPHLGGDRGVHLGGAHAGGAGRCR